MSTQTQLSGDNGRDEGKDSNAPALRLDALTGAMESLGEAPKKRLPVQLIMLVGLVVVAGGSLLAMRKLGMGPSGAEGNEVKIDYDDKGSLASADHQKVLDDLTSSHIEQQVPTEQVQRNPFKMAESLQGTLKAKPEVVDDGSVKTLREKEEAERLQREIEERRALIQSTKDSLKVHSVLGGSSPLARINNEVVRVGQKVADMFTVTAIHDRSVELSLDGQTYTISMDGDAEGSKPPPAPASAPPLAPVKNTPGKPTSTPPSGKK